MGRGGRTKAKNGPARAGEIPEIIAWAYSWDNSKMHLMFGTKDLGPLGRILCGASSPNQMEPWPLSNPERDPNLCQHCLRAWCESMFSPQGREILIKPA